MSGVFGDVFAQSVLDQQFGGTGTVPTEHEIGLSLTVPNSDGSGVAEPVGGGYARVTVLNTVGTWAPASDRVKTNAAPINFPTATGAWGDPVCFVVFTGGSYVGYGTLDGHGPIAAGITPSFAPGQLSISLPSS